LTVEIGVFITMGVIGVSATFLLHSLACGLHVEAVDEHGGPNDKGMFYRYCRCAAKPLKLLEKL
jgi:hypothetical protein